MLSIFYVVVFLSHFLKTFNNIYIQPTDPQSRPIHSPVGKQFVLFLPPANEVWGKVIFSEACVKNSVHGGGLPQCMLGYHSPPDQAGTSPRYGRYGQRAGSMHPTRMQSCCIMSKINVIRLDFSVYFIHK